MIKYFLLALILTSTFETIAFKSNPDSILVENYLDKASLNLDSANHYYIEASKVAEGDFLKLRVNRLWATYYYNQRKLDLAESKINESFIFDLNVKYNENISQEIAKSLFLMSLIHKLNGDFDTEKEILHNEVAFIEYNNNILAEEAYRAYSHLGLNRRNIGNLIDAEKWLKKSLEIAIEGNLVFEKIKAYGNLGLLYHNLHRSKTSRQYSYLVLDELERLDSANRPIYFLYYVFAAYHNIGMTYASENNLDSALIYYSKSLGIWDEIDNAGVTNQHSEAYVYSNMAIIYMTKGDYEQAASSAEKAIEILISIFGDTHVQLIKTYRALGEVLIKKEEYEPAKKVLLNVLTISRKNSQDLPASYNAIAEYNERINEPEIAISYYDSAIENNRVPLTKGIYKDYDAILYSMIGKVRISMQLVENHGKSTLDTLNTLFDESLNILDYTLNKKEDRILDEAIIELLECFYLKYMDLYQADNERKWLEKLWTISELNKSIKLKSHLKNEYAIKYSIPKETLIKEQNLRDSIETLIRSIKPNQIDSSLFFLQRRYDEFIAKIKVEHPKYFNLKHSNNIIPLEQKQKELDENDILYSFFEGKNNIYTLKIRNSSIVNAKTEKNNIDSLINVFNSKIINGENDLIEVSQEIRDKLLLDDLFISEAHHVLVIPDGLLWKLSFGSLSFESNNERRLLSQVHSFQYLNYVNNKSKQKSSSSSNLLAFSYSSKEAKLIGENTNYTSLRDLDEYIPGTSEEVVEIAELWTGDYYFSLQANETLFKSESENYNIIHLAIHGFQDEYFPENSYLKFAQEDSINDGKLYAYEIYNLQLNADMVVLSACNSGKGKIVTGEGMMSLGQAFSYAGVKSLIVSHWEVPDSSTPYIMKYFYEGLKKGLTKSKSLKFAQNKFLLNDADNITSQPFYWSGFYVLGEDDPITKKNISIRNIFILIAFIGLISGTFFYFRRSSNS